VPKADHVDIGRDLALHIEQIFGCRRSAGESEAQAQTGSERVQKHSFAQIVLRRAYKAKIHYFNLGFNAVFNKHLSKLVKNSTLFSKIPSSGVNGACVKCSHFGQQHGNVFHAALVVNSQLSGGCKIQSIASHSLAQYVHGLTETFLSMVPLKFVVSHMQMQNRSARFPAANSVLGYLPWRGWYVGVSWTLVIQLLSGLQ
jgi:hypothetical protein